MKPGIYLAGRSLAFKGIANKANHQFLVVVPSKATTLAGYTRLHKGVRYLLLGAYSVNNYLRAAMCAQSDDISFKSSINSDGKNGAQLNFAEVQMCLIDPDLAITEIFKSFTRYKSFEGKSDEIEYPTFAQQFDSSKFNSNSWANSCLFWGSLRFGTQNNSDFSGIDIGDDRLIPKRYFHM